MEVHHGVTAMQTGRCVSSYWLFTGWRRWTAGTAERGDYLLHWRASCRARRPWALSSWLSRHSSCGRAFIQILSPGDCRGRGLTTSGAISLRGSTADRAPHRLGVVGVDAGVVPGAAYRHIKLLAAVMFTASVCIPSAE